MTVQPHPIFCFTVPLVLFVGKRQAVDTGWINDEKPIDLAVKHEKTHHFQTPLDEIDAAARFEFVLHNINNL